VFLDKKAGGAFYSIQEEYLVARQEIMWFYPLSVIYVSRVDKVGKPSSKQ